MNFLIGPCWSSFKATIAEQPERREGPIGKLPKSQEKASAEIQREFFPNKLSGGILRGGGFWGPFPSKTQDEKIRLKIHSEVEIRIWELHG